MQARGVIVTGKEDTITPLNANGDTASSQLLEWDKRLEDDIRGLVCGLR